MGRASKARWMCDRRGSMGFAGGGIGGSVRKPPVYCEGIEVSIGGKLRSGAVVRFEFDEPDEERFLRNGILEMRLELPGSAPLGSGWSAPITAGWTPPLYPRMHLLPNGKVFYSGSTSPARTFNPATGTWLKSGSHTKRRISA